MIYRREDLEVVRTSWLPALKHILSVSKPFTNYGVGLLDPSVCTEADPVPEDSIKWLVECVVDAEPLDLVDNIVVMSVGMEVVDAELWGVIGLAAPIDLIDKLVKGLDGGNLLVFLGTVGKTDKRKYVTAAIDAAVGLKGTPGAPTRIGFVFDPECVETKEA